MKTKDSDLKDINFYKTAEGYNDPTAGKALSKLYKEQMEARKRMRKKKKKGVSSNEYKPRTNH